MLEMYDDLLTVEEACEALKMGKNALYELLASGKLKAFRTGSRCGVFRETSSPCDAFLRSSICPRMWSTTAVSGPTGWSTVCRGG